MDSSNINQDLVTITGIPTGDMPVMFDMIQESLDKFEESGGGGVVLPTGEIPTLSTWMHYSMIVRPEPFCNSNFCLRLHER
jgi:hypothetical protein